MNTATKRGRKQRHHHDSITGLPVLGLARLTDGKRWRVMATGYRFTEPDEQRAIERYRRMNAGPPMEGMLLGQPFRATREELHDLRDSVSAMIEAHEREAYAKFAADLRQRPQRVAELTGIEQLGYLPDLKPPTPLPSLDELRAFWSDNAKCSTAQMKKVRRAFDDFLAVTAIAGLHRITRAVVHDYEKAITARGDTGKQQFHLVTGVRRILRFYLKRRAEGDAATAIRNVLDALGSLEIQKPVKNLDPRPIEVEDWNRLLAVADPTDRAMLLLMLNGSFYIGEVVRLEWSDINLKTGCLVTTREKTGKCVRCCVLWRETLDALSKLTRAGNAIFYAYNGEPIKVSGLQRRWQRLALRAGLATQRSGACKKKIVKCRVTASQIRDGAYTAAAGSPDVPERMCRLFNGHSCGIADHYVKRNPMMVAPACQAVYRHYFVDGDHRRLR